jgi:15-cis-phytoene synthase
MIDTATANECRAIIRHHSKSFALASSLLPRAVRDEVSVVYAWCRTVDDAIDHSQGAEQQANLRRIRRELDAVFNGDPMEDPNMRALQRVVTTRRIPKHYFTELVNGLEMDATGMRYETFQDLLSYCFRVAGTVGLIMCHVLGVRHPIALRHAAHLGIAMQITNICRDVREDWARGRLYIPVELLRKHGAAHLSDLIGQPMPPDAREPLAHAVKELLVSAARYYASGNDGLRYLTWRCTVAVRTASVVYARIGDKVAQTGYDVFAGRVFVPKAEKLRVILRTLAASVPELSHSTLVVGKPPRLPRNLVVRFPEDVLPV